MICFHVNLKEGMDNIDFFQPIPSYNLLLVADADKITKSFPFLCLKKKSSKPVVLKLRCSKQRWMIYYNMTFSSQNA